jgi:hypothetical protein
VRVCVCVCVAGCVSSVSARVCVCCVCVSVSVCVCVCVAGVPVEVVCWCVCEWCLIVCVCVCVCVLACVCVCGRQSRCQHSGGWGPRQLRRCRAQWPGEVKNNYKLLSGCWCMVTDAIACRCLHCQKICVHLLRWLAHDSRHRQALPQAALQEEAPLPKATYFFLYRRRQSPPRHKPPVVFRVMMGRFQFTLPTTRAI